jgi:GAF domain-containing protein
MATGELSPTDPQEAFAELSKIVLGDEPLEAILERVVHLAKRVLPASVEASITLLNATKTETAAFTGPLAIELDERQYEVERGPCLDAAASGQRIWVTDMRSETRWPQFAASASARGVRTSLSIPLPIQRHVTGALNFYGLEPDAFDDESIELAETFAAHAAVAVANAHLYDSTAALARNMQEAMATRAVIEQAKGIIMRDRRCSADDAFDALVSLSQQAHVKLREVAQRLVDQVSNGE